MVYWWCCLKVIQIEGFTADLTPDDKPAVSIYGPEGTGKTRFAATAPGPIGLLALDKKSKRTFQKVASAMEKQVVVNKEDYISGKDAIKLAMLDTNVEAQRKQIKEFYGKLFEKVMETGLALASHPDIETIVIDTATQLWDWIMFSHFGRRNQVESYQRGAPNQDMIDLINALKNKNLVLIHRAKDEWKDTGEVDSQGRKKQAPSGKFQAEGFTKMGYFATVICELSAAPKASEPDDKFKIKLVKCQPNSLLEGQDMAEYGLRGESITWENVMTVIGAEE